jgi:hypothetical protein
VAVICLKDRKTDIFTPSRVLSIFTTWFVAWILSTCLILPACSAQTSQSAASGVQTPATLSMPAADQMLKTEEHTVTALANMYTVATWIAGIVVLVFGYIGFRSYKDFTEKLNQAQIDFNRIKSDSEAEVKKLNDELSKAVEQRIALRGEHAERIASLEVARTLQIDELEKQKEFLNKRIIDALDLGEKVKIIEHEFAKIVRAPKLEQPDVTKKLKGILLFNLDEARKLSRKLGHTRLESWVEAVHGRLHLYQGEWEDARSAMLKAEDLDVGRKIRSPARSFNLACLYGDWFKADVNSQARHDFEAMRWCNETVSRAIHNPDTSHGRGHWANLLLTDPELDAVRAKYPVKFEEMIGELTSE